MTALVSAELLRLRTVRSPRWIALGILALLAVLAAATVLDGAGAPTAEQRAALRALAFAGVLMAAAFAASTVGSEFKRGAAAATYLVHPDRGRVTVARLLTYAGIGAVFAALAAAVVAATGVTAASTEGVDAGLPGDAVLRLLTGAVVGGAVLGAGGALAGTLTRNPTVATGAIVGFHLGEGLLRVAGVGPYLPFGLVEGLMGGPGDLPWTAAVALLLLFLVLFAAVVRVWALPRDLT